MNEFLLKTRCIPAQLAEAVEYINCISAEG